MLSSGQKMSNRSTAVESVVARVDTALSEVFTFDIRLYSGFAVSIQNQGQQALNAFALDLAVVESGVFFEPYSAAADWTNPSATGYIKSASGSPVTLAAGESISFHLNELTGWGVVRLRASVVSGSTELKITVSKGGQ